MRRQDWEICIFTCEFDIFLCEMLTCESKVTSHVNKKCPRMKFTCESQTFLHVEVPWGDFSTVVLPLKQTFARDNKSTIKLKVF